MIHTNVMLTVSENIFCPHLNVLSAPVGTNTCTQMWRATHVSTVSFERMFDPKVMQ
jgi:hypothetical protein